jgi:hypothetical protein
MGKEELRKFGGETFHKATTWKIEKEIHLG